MRKDRRPPRSPTLDEFDAYVEDRPRRLGCWRHGAPERHPSLAWLNVEPVIRQVQLSQEIGWEAAAAINVSAHHNVVGISSGWVVTRMRGQGRGASPTYEERQALFNVAGQYWQLRNALVEVRVGVRGFEADGHVVRMPYLGDSELDALDRILDLLPVLEAIDAPRYAPSQKLRQWSATEGRSTPWSRAPGWVRAGFRRMAAATLARYDTYLPPEQKLAGFTIGEFDRFWEVLLAWGMQMQIAVMNGARGTETIAPLLEREAAVGQLAAEAEVGESAVDAMVQVLTLDLGRCPDGALTPLVPVDDRLLPMSSIIVPSAPQRNLLANVASDPAMVGDAGRLLGLAGERATAEALERMSSGVLIATRVKVRRTNGEPAGDLDVVVCDPSAQVMAIFEIKWHLAADGNAEVYRAAKLATDKRSQVTRLRGEIAAGQATVRWPANWPDVGSFTQRWFVLTRDVLPLQDIDDDEVTVRSLQLIQRTVRKDATGHDLIAALEHPPVPPDVLTATDWESFRFGDLRVEVEVVRA